MTFLNTNQVRKYSELAEWLNNTNNMFRSSVAGTFVDYPWGITDNRNVYITFFYDGQPGHRYFEIDQNGDVVHQWTGGLD